MVDATTLTQGALGYVASLSIEISIAIVAFLVIVGFGLQVGKNGLVTLLLSIFVSSFIVSILPFDIATILKLGIWFNRIDGPTFIIFLFITLITYVIIWNVIEVNVARTRFQTLLEVSFLSLVIIIVATVGLVTSGSIDKIESGSIIAFLFTSPVINIAWLLTSLGFLFLTTR